MILLHFHKDEAIGEEPLEYIVLVEGDDRLPGEYLAQFGAGGYEMNLHDSSDTFEWPTSLPTDRRLIPG